eukprot:scaffold4383_cov390-Prasinococcus_capsulatus_cf.AAC.4
MIGRGPCARIGRHAAPTAAVKAEPSYPILRVAARCHPAPQEHRWTHPPSAPDHRDGPLDARAPLSLSSSLGPAALFPSLGSAPRLRRPSGGCRQHRSPRKGGATAHQQERRAGHHQAGVGRERGGQRSGGRPASVQWVSCLPMPRLPPPRVRSCTCPPPAGEVRPEEDPRGELGGQARSASASASAVSPGSANGAHAGAIWGGGFSALPSRQSSLETPRPDVGPALLTDDAWMDGWLAGSAPPRGSGPPVRMDGRVGGEKTAAALLLLVRATPCAGGGSAQPLAGGG